MNKQELLNNSLVNELLISFGTICTYKNSMKTVKEALYEFKSRELGLNIEGYATKVYEKEKIAEDIMETKIFHFKEHIMYSLKKNWRLSFKEQLEIAKQIAKDTGLENALD